MLFSWIWLRPRYKIPEFFMIAPVLPPIWRFAAEIAAIRRLYIGLRVHYKFYKKHSRFSLAWSRPRADRSLSRPKCTPYNNSCVQNFIQIGWDLAVWGKNLSLSKNRSWPSILKFLQCQSVIIWDNDDCCCLLRSSRSSNALPLDSSGDFHPHAARSFPPTSELLACGYLYCTSWAPPALPQLMVHHQIWTARTMTSTQWTAAGHLQRRRQQGRTLPWRRRSAHVPRVSEVRPCSCRTCRTVGRRAAALQYVCADGWCMSCGSGMTGRMSRMRTAARPSAGVNVAPAGCAACTPCRTDTRTDVHLRDAHTPKRITIKHWCYNYYTH